MTELSLGHARWVLVTRSNLPQAHTLGVSFFVVLSHRSAEITHPQGPVPCHGAAVVPRCPSLAQKVPWTPHLHGEVAVALLRLDLHDLALLHLQKRDGVHSTVVIPR